MAEPATADAIEGVLEPRANPRLIGHAAAERQLLEAWASGRLHHGWLLSGPRGIGKATLVYRFARFLLANGSGGEALFRPRDLAVPTDHPVFARVASGGHPDLFTLARSLDDRGRFQTVINVDNARRLGEFFALTAGEGGWRVAVIDGAEEMNPNAANAILKILEEPPKRAVLLLVSHAPGRLLPTIRSRVRQLVLRPLDDASVAQLVRESFPDLPPAAAGELATLAAGSPGRAMRLAAQGGLELNQELGRVLAVMPELDIPALHALADRAARGEQGQQAFAVLAELIGHWLARLIRGEDPELAALRDRANLDQWFAVWEKVSALFARADGANLDRKQVLLNAVLAVQRAAGG